MLHNKIMKIEPIESAGNGYSQPQIVVNSRPSSPGGSTSPTGRVSTDFEDDDDKYDDIQAVLEKNTPAARRRELAQLIVLLMVPISCLLALTTLQVVNSTNVLSIVHEGIEVLNNDKQFAQVVVNLQVERGLTAMYLSSKGENEIAKLQLQGRRIVSDKSVRLLQTWSENALLVQGTKLRSSTDLLMIIDGHRYAVDLQVDSMDTTFNIFFYTNVTQTLMEWLRYSINIPTKFDAWRYMLHNSMFLLATDAVGIQRALGSTFVTKCIPGDGELEWFNDLGAQAEALEQLAFDICEECEDIYENLYKTHSKVMERINEGKNNFNSEQWQQKCSLTSSNERFVLSKIWFDDVTVRISEIMVITRLHHMNLTTDSLRIEEDGATTGMVTFITVILIETICLFIVAIWFSFKTQQLIDQMKKFVHMSSNMQAVLRKEKVKTENLLCQLLPPLVVEQFKNGKTVEPEHHEAVTFLFTDIVNFTAYCATATPLHVVDLLNVMFSNFDREIDKRDAFKLETVGDAYVVSSGMPYSNGHRHVMEICRLALDIRAYMINFRPPNQRAEQRIQIRLGIHTGSCCSGVVGVTMPRYCAFGDSLRIGNLMESTSLPSKIQLSMESYQLLTGVSNDFDVCSRDDGVKIPTYSSSTYWLQGVRSTLTVESSSSVRYNNDMQSRSSMKSASAMRAESHLSLGAKQPDKIDSLSMI